MYILFVQNGKELYFQTYMIVAGFIGDIYMFQKLKTLITHFKTQRMYNKLLRPGFVSDTFNPETGARTVFKIKDKVNTVTVTKGGIEEMRIRIGPCNPNQKSTAYMRTRINKTGQYLNKDNSVLKIY